MKKYDMKTRQGRARRRSSGEQFNPATLLPNAPDYRASKSVKADMKRRKAARWNDILHGEHVPTKAFPDA